MGVSESWHAILREKIPIRNRRYYKDMWGEVVRFFCQEKAACFEHHRCLNDLMADALKDVEDREDVIQWSTLLGAMLACALISNDADRQRKHIAECMEVGRRHAKKISEGN